jgi:hypothetical protein
MVGCDRYFLMSDQIVKYSFFFFFFFLKQLFRLSLLEIAAFVWIGLFGFMIY